MSSYKLEKNLKDAVQELLSHKAREALTERVERKKKVIRGGKLKKINKATAGDEAGKTRLSGRTSAQRRQQGLKSKIGKRKAGGVKSKSLAKAKRSVRKGKAQISGRA